MKGTKIVYPELTLTDGMEIYLGSRKVEIIYTGSSHTDGSIMAYLPDKKFYSQGTFYSPIITHSWEKGI